MSLLYPAFALVLILFVKASFFGSGGQGVSVLAFYFDNLSSNPTEVYNFLVNFLLKRTRSQEIH